MQSSNKKLSNIDAVIQDLHNDVRPSVEMIIELCSKSKQILSQEPNVLSIPAPVTICGDIHGQFYDLLELFRLGGDMPQSRYLFLGDYVNRGYHSIETFLLLLSLKLKHPDRVHLLRGNHECRQVCQVYGLYDECLAKYNESVWKALSDVFDYLPLAAVVDNQMFCAHGGLSPSITNIDQIAKINRFQEVPVEGPITDLLWSDPVDTNGFNENPRGAGITFGPDVTKRFLEENNLKMISRAHTLVMEGYDLTHDNQTATIFSAPNYCYRCANKGALVKLTEGLTTEVKIYGESTNPKARVSYRKQQ